MGHGLRRLAAIASAACLAALLVGASSADPAPPANDDFAAAQVIAGPLGSTSGSIAAATAENPCGPNVLPTEANPCEPNHGTPTDPANANGLSFSGHPTGCWGGSCATYPSSAGYPNPAYKSVWFAWTAPSSASVEFTTTGSDFDSVLSVYDSPSESPGFANLALVAGNDDCQAQTGVGGQSCVRFVPVAGQTYWVAIDQGDSLFQVPQPAYDYVLNWFQAGAVTATLATNIGQQTVSGTLSGSPAVYGWTPPPGPASISTAATCQAAAATIGADTIDSTGTLTTAPGDQIAAGQAGTLTLTGDGRTEYFVVAQGAGSFCFIARQALPVSLALTDASSSATVSPGAAYTYNLVASNTGGGTAVGATVSDSLPAGATFLSATVGCTFTAGTVSCPVSLPGGSSAPIAITVAAPTVNQTTSVADSAVLSASNAGSVTASASTVVLGGADLALTDSVNPPSAGGGASLVYTLSVTNSGPLASQAVTLTDAIPAGTTFVLSSAGCVNGGGTVTCALGSLAVGGSDVVTIIVSIPLLTSISSAGDLASVTAATNDPNPVNNIASTTVPVSGLPLGCTAGGAVHGDGHWSFTNGGTVHSAHVIVDATCALDKSGALVISKAHVNVDGDAAVPQVNAHTDGHSNDITGVEIIGTDAVVIGSYQGVPFALVLHDGGTKSNALNNGDTMSFQYGPFSTLPGLTPTTTDVDVQGSPKH